MGSPCLGLSGARPDGGDRSRHIKLLNYPPSSQARQPKLAVSIFSGQSGPSHWCSRISSGIQSTNKSTVTPPDLLIGPLEQGLAGTYINVNNHDGELTEPHRKNQRHPMVHCSSASQAVDVESVAGLRHPRCQVAINLFPIHPPHSV